MTQYNFEGDLSGISEPQLEFINNVIQEHGFENSKVTFEQVGAAGDNYIACVKRIIIEGENRSLKMIAKIAPTHEMLRQLQNAAVLFKNEHIMYLDVLPKLVQLQKDAGIPEDEQLKFAKCYGSNGEQPNEVILLEDLKELDFKMLDRFQPLSNDCVKSILKNFAILHSLSFALKHKESMIYDNLNTSLIDMWPLLAPQVEMKLYLQGLEVQTLSMIENQDHINLVKHKVADFLNYAVKLAKTDYNDKYAVILQGDSWTNNVMFKFEGDQLLDSIMIDYQVSKNGSPVYDLMYMIFNCTDHESRIQHYYDWIDYYHLELDKSLSNFNLKANFVYPRDKLDADLKRYAKLMFGISVMLGSMLIRKSEDAAKVMDAMNSDNMLEHTEALGVSQLDEEARNLFKGRINGLINSFIEFGLL